jgi:hypothetical protein
MVSLLVDMGLFAEALFIERKLRSDPVRFWYPNRLGKRREEKMEYEEGEYTAPGYWGQEGAPAEDGDLPQSGWDDQPGQESGQAEGEGVPFSGESSPIIFSPTEERPQPTASVPAGGSEGEDPQGGSTLKKQSEIGETY